MGNIFTDFATAVKATAEIRKARKAGADAVQIKPVYTVPMLKTGYFTWTMEACLIYQDTFKAVCTVFETLPEKTQHNLTFTPKESGEWVERAKFWQNLLKPALPPKMYHTVMIRFISWYAHCLRQRRAAV